MYAGDWRMKAEGNCAESGCALGVSKVCFGDASVYRHLQACSQVFYRFFAWFMLTCLRVRCEC